MAPGQRTDGNQHCTKYTFLLSLSHC